MHLNFWSGRCGGPTALTSVAFCQHPLCDSRSRRWLRGGCLRYVPQGSAAYQVCISRCQPRSIPASQRLRNSTRRSDQVCITYQSAAMDLIMASERLAHSTLLLCSKHHCWRVGRPGSHPLRKPLLWKIITSEYKRPWLSEKWGTTAVGQRAVWGSCGQETQQTAGQCDMPKSSRAQANVHSGRTDSGQLAFPIQMECGVSTFPQADKGRFSSSLCTHSRHSVPELALSALPPGQCSLPELKPLELFLRASYCLGITPATHSPTPHSVNSSPFSRSF